MASPKTYINNGRKTRVGQSGITLTEIMVVIGLLAMIGSLGLMMSMDSYRGYMFRGERDTIVASLQRARSLAVSNICEGVACTDGQPHGLRFEAGEYVIFQGQDYVSGDAGNTIIPAQSKAVQITGPPQIVFSQLSGGVDAATSTIDIVVTDTAGHSSTILVNKAGQILWSN